jgi:hypothetical protein
LLQLPAAGNNAAVETEPPKVDPPKRKRRWYQFSLRMLMIVFRSSHGRSFRMPRISAITVFVLFFVAVVSKGGPVRVLNYRETGGAVVAFADDAHGAALSAAKTGGEAGPRIQAIEPSERDFYAKLLDYDGIPIKAPKQVSDEALFQARARLAMMLEKLPAVRRKLKAAGAELHIIGKNQVTSDLPEHRHLKGKPFDGKLTVDERTRGLGGLLTSCGEENLLRLRECKPSRPKLSRRNASAAGFSSACGR